MRGGVARGERRLRLGEALGDGRIADQAGAEVVPLAADRRELLARRRQIFERRGGHRGAGQLAQSDAAPLDILPLGVALLTAARGALELAHQLVVMRPILERRHPFPLGGRELELLERLLALQLVDPLAQLETRTRDHGARLAGRRSVSARSASCCVRASASRAARSAASRSVRRPPDGRRGSGGRAPPAAACSRRLFLCSAASLLVHLADDGARALRGALVPGARRDLFELGAVGDAFDRGQRRILELAVEGDAEQLAMILQRVKRHTADALVLGVAGNRSERVAVADADPRQRRPRGRLARRVLGDADDGFRVLDRGDRRQALGLADPLERFERDIAQHGQRLRPHLLVGVGLRDRGERRRIHQLRDRGAPHPGIGVLARDLVQQLALVERQLLHELQPDRGVGILVTGVSAESIKQCHMRSSLAVKPACLGAGSACEPRTPN